MVKRLEQALHEYFVQIGRKGGKKGGKTTGERRTAAERSAAARKAVQARWAKKKKEDAA